ncbi:hypothetical protein Lfu02_28210 [Longispora fulva]|uniref:Flagellar basal body-associated protein FliL n=1 Tax=Longispora fulva TaxID=619741 RepID=A0A8J7GIY2_9ACTN|nr:DUF4129 domain-containing protein [Longispora fulva]MBG6138956.1 flagellar basal body-associated protein FliL [Longispora fulva]GIG58449.1 hypothetical protein Lfu02_28210 [Longispora fulva]
MNIARGLWRWGPLVIVVALLGAVATAAARTSVQATRLPMPMFTHPPPTPPEDIPQKAIQSGEPAAGAVADSGGWPSWVWILLLSIVGAILVSVVVAVLWTVVKDNIRIRVRPYAALNPVNGAPEVRVEEVRAAVRAGLDALDDLGDPRRAVIACWLGLEAAAAEAGTVRQTGDTPTELVGRLLAEHHVSSGGLGDFVELYRLARYAPHIVDEDMRLRARSALAQLHDELAREVTA